MIARLEAELQHEKEVLAKRKAEGRSDYIALALLSRIEREIETLEWRLEHERGKKRSKHENTYSILHNVKKAIGRYGANCYRYYNAISSIFIRATLQKAESAK